MYLEAFSMEKWVNCIGNQRCQPCLYDEPYTFEDLCHRIKQAVMQGLTVRAIGNGYSLSDTFSSVEHPLDVVLTSDHATSGL